MKIKFLRDKPKYKYSKIKNNWLLLIEKQLLPNKYKNKKLSKIHYMADYFFNVEVSIVFLFKIIK